MHRILAIAGVTALAGASGACNSDEAAGNSLCTPGALVGCQCLDGNLGWTLCDMAGTPGPNCNCASAGPCAAVLCSGHGVCAESGDAALCVCDVGYERVGTECIATGDPCLQNDCSGHGTCVPLSNAPFCVCDVGYEYVDGGCVQLSDPCAEIACSGHGICAVVGGAGVCVCDGGYQQQGADCVPTDPQNPCSGVDCGDHGTCALVDWQPVCVCDPGYFLDVDTCQEVVGPSCSGVSCSNHGVCTLTVLGAACACDVGFHPAGLSCIEDDPLDPCASVTCSGHGSCNPNGGWAICVCDTDYHSLGADCAENGTIAVSHTLDKIIADPMRPYLYAASNSSGYVLIIDRQTGVEQAAVHVALSIDDIDLDANAGILYAVSKSGTLIGRYDVVANAFAPPIFFAPPADHSQGLHYHVEAGPPGRVFFVDAAWQPTLHVLDTTSGLELSTYSGCGIGDLELSSDGTTLFVWEQYGWGAGLTTSYVRRLDVSSDAVGAIEVGTINVQRDPVTTPMLVGGGRLATKKYVLRDDDLDYVVANLPSPAYAFAGDGNVVVTSSAAYSVVSPALSRPLTVSSTVMVMCPDCSDLYIYDGANNRILVQSLAGL